MFLSLYRLNKIHSAFLGAQFRRRLIMTSMYVSLVNVSVVGLNVRAVFVAPPSRIYYRSHELDKHHEHLAYCREVSLHPFSRATVIVPPETIPNY